MAVDNREDEIKQITRIIRAYAISSKPPCYLKNILRDYQESEGQCIPFKRLGFNSAIELLRSTKAFNFGQYQNEITISAEYNEKSAHIAKMVQQQKKTRPRANPVRRLNPIKTASKNVHQQNYNNNSNSRLPQKACASQKPLTCKNADDSVTQPRKQYSKSQSNCASEKSAGSTSFIAENRQQDFEKRKRQERELEVKRERQILEQQLNQQWQEQQHRLRQQRQLEQQQNQQYLECQQWTQQHHEIQWLRQHQQQEQYWKQQQRDREQHGRRAQQRHQQQQNQQQQKQQQQNRRVVVVSTSGPRSDPEPKSKISERLIIRSSSENVLKIHNNKKIEKSSNNLPKRIEITFDNLQPSERSTNVKKKQTALSWSSSELALREYCVQKKLPLPIYSSSKNPTKKKYNCLVKIGDFTYSTYPSEFSDLNVAQISCATEALKILMEKKLNCLPICKDSTCEILAKIHKKLLNHPSGMFARNIPEWFEETFQCSLPENWLSLVNSSKRFEIDTPIPKMQNTIVFANPSTLDDIVLPWDEEFWPVYITHCVSTTEIWGRLWGEEYSDRFEELIIRIEEYMENNMEMPPIITYHQINLICIQDCWHRVRVEQIDRDKELVQCFFIDFGDREWCSEKELYYCPPQFLELPAQAIRFSMYGLEEFETNSQANKSLELLLPYLMVSIKHLTTPEQHEIDEAQGNSKISGIFYDTSSANETYGSSNDYLSESCSAKEIVLNDLLTVQVCSSIPPPSLHVVGITNVIVTHINDEGMLSFQVINNELQYLQKLMHEVLSNKVPEDFVHCRATFDDLKMKKIFLVRVNVDADGVIQWQRAMVADDHFFQFDKEFNMYFIDRGYNQCVHISNIYCMDGISTALSVFVGQSMQCSLQNIMNPSNKTLNRIRTLLPENCQALVKLVDGITSKIPVVAVYRRFEDADVVSNINDSLCIEDELNSDDGPTSAYSSSDHNVDTVSKHVVMDMMKDMNISHQIVMDCNTK